MDKLTKQHLENINITVDNMMDFKSEVFSVYASAKGVKLGFDAYGQFLVKKGDEVFKSNNPAIAIDKYTELLLE